MIVGLEVNLDSTTVNRNSATQEGLFRHREFCYGQVSSKCFKGPVVPRDNRFNSAAAENLHTAKSKPQINFKAKICSTFDRSKDQGRKWLNQFWACCSKKKMNMFFSFFFLLFHRFVLLTPWAANLSTVAHSTYFSFFFFAKASPAPAENVWPNLNDQDAVEECVYT